MMATWTLPNGLEIRFDGPGMIDVKYPKAERWHMLTNAPDDADRLLAILNVEIPIARKRAGR
ncbi:MAG TPA: hypothetical protein VNI01_01505 [Elusimicrobiota bacterium]|nr:hypothetical protein [Elusimicrobiota bacterium]